MKPILRLDYRDWTSGNEEQRQRFIEQIIESLETTGFVKLINHGFAPQQLKEAFDLSRRFFDQPGEAKEEILNHTNPNRGYTKVGDETTSLLSHGVESKATKDTKEAFDQGNKDDEEYPNQWPKGIPGFRTFMEAFYEGCDTVCLTLIKALEAGLDIHDECISKRCIPSGTDFRLTHYPAMPLEEVKSGRRIRIASHVDFGVISLLFQDGVGGLEVEDRTKPGPESFIPIVPSNNWEMIVNLGATMQRWTNDRLFGGLHRVSVPPEMKGDKKSGDAIIPRRLSVAYLFKANHSVSVGPLPAFVNKDTPAKYPEMSGLEYHQWCNSRFY